MVELRKLNRADPDISPTAKLYSEAFSQSLYPPFEKLLTFSEKTDTDILGIYACGRFSGFMYFLKGFGFAYLMYFAVLPNEQSKGLGSQALQETVRMYESYTCVLDIEPMGSTPDAVELFRRRKDFYVRNGFLETGYSICHSGLALEVLSTNKDMNFGRFEELLRHIITIYTAFSASE